MTEIIPPATANPASGPESAAQNEPVLTLAPEDMPNVEHLATENNMPVDNWFSEKQQRLLTAPLYDSWQGPSDDRPFLVAANVGIFYAVRKPPLVPNVFLSVDARPPADWWAKPRRSYFTWEFGGYIIPRVVIDIVSDARSVDFAAKFDLYAWPRIPYCVIFDPKDQMQKGMLRAYELKPLRTYVERSPDILPGACLGLRLWQGVFEGQEDTWLRWQDESGALIPTGAERAAQEKDRAERAESRAERLAALLHAHSISAESDGKPL